MNIFSQWPLTTWVIIGLIGTVLIILESAYRTIKEERQNKDKGFNEYEQRIVQLTDQLTVAENGESIKNPFEITRANFDIVEGVPNIYAGVDVKNLANVVIEDCQLWLSEVVDLQNRNKLSPINAPIQLGWSDKYGTRGNGKVETPPLLSIEMDMSKRCDIAMTMPGQHKATFRVPEHLEGKSPYTINQGVYRLTIIAKGNLNKIPIRHLFSIILSFQSDDNLWIDDKVTPVEKTR